MHKIFLIIEREYLTRVKKKSFLLMTLLGPVLMAALISLIIWMSMAEDSRQLVLVVDNTPGYFSAMKKSKNVEFEHSKDITLEEGKKLFHNSSYTSMLYIPPNIINSNAVQLYFKKQPSSIIQKYIESEIERVAEEIKLDKLYTDLNLDESQVDKSLFHRIKTNVNLITIKFKENGQEEEIFTDQAWVGFFFGLLIYMFIFLYGIQVLRGVIEEKSSRIVEVIVSSVKPIQLMLGKIIGVAMVGLTQFLVWVLLTFSIVAIVQTVVWKEFYDPATLEQVQMSAELMKAQQSQSINPGDSLNLIQRINFPLMLGMFAFYFIGGYLLYSALFAAIGAAVDNETETQQFMLPVTMPLILAYVASIQIVQNPEGPMAFWFSIIPFTSPVVMMVRLAIGFESGDIWQLYLSMALLIAGFLLATWVAARIYRTGILMYGKKASYKELWKWLRFSG